ncbi:Methyltransferase domain protein [anaerobic digester metagenome]
MQALWTPHGTARPAIRLPGFSLPGNDAPVADWNATWTTQRRQQLVTPGFLPQDAFFGASENAERYRGLVAASYHGDVEEQLAWMGIPAGATILDIGSGPGTLAVPLAERGCRVTAVEPSPPMRRLLREAAAHAAVEVEVIDDTWERVDPASLDGPFDAVIASYSLMMVELQSALEAMNAACCGRVFLFWPLTLPGGRVVERALWPLVHGADYPPEPLAGCVHRLLCQMGLAPRLGAKYRRFWRRFADLDEAVAEFRWRLNRPSCPSDLLGEALLRLLPEDRDGTLLLDRSSWDALISWDARRVSATQSSQVDGGAPGSR